MFKVNKYAYWAFRNSLDRGRLRGAEIAREGKWPIHAMMPRMSEISWPITYSLEELFKSKREVIGLLIASPV